MFRIVNKSGEEWTAPSTEEINQNSNIIYYSNDSSMCIIETELSVAHISSLTETEVEQLVLTDEWNIN